MTERVADADPASVIRGDLKPSGQTPEGWRFGGRVPTERDDSRVKTG